jgi:hypothetical protein
MKSDVVRPQPATQQIDHVWQRFGMLDLFANDGHFEDILSLSLDQISRMCTIGRVRLLFTESRLEAFRIHLRKK